MKKLIYLTTNPNKVNEANEFFGKKYGFNLEIVKPDFEILEHCFAFCEPGKKAIVFSGGGTGTIAYEAKGTRGRWHDKFYIPDGETKTLSELRDIDYERGYILGRCKRSIC